MSTFTLIQAISGRPFTISEFNTDLVRIMNAIRDLQDQSVGSGSVTTFSSGNLSPLFTTSVATATTTPALSFALSTHTANTVFAGPTSGGVAAPTFRSLVLADIPLIDYTKGGLGISTIGTAYQGLRTNSGATAYEHFTISPGSTKLSVTPGAGSLALDVVPGNITINSLNTSTPLAIGAGGSGAATQQAAINALTAASGGTVAYVLTLDGSKNAVWSAVSAAVSSVNSATGAVTLTLTNNNAANQWNGAALNIRTATTSNQGLLSDTDWTTFNAKLKSIGDTVTSGTAASVLYLGASNVLAQDNSNFSYDGTAHTLTVKNLIRTGSVTNTKIRTTTGTDTATSADSSVYCDPTSSAYTQTLPDCATVTAGYEIRLKRITTGAGNVTVSVQNAATDLIDDATTKVFGAINDFLWLQYYGSNRWKILSKQIT